MKIKTVELTATSMVKILNEKNFNDFNTKEQAKFLLQEALDQSPWPIEGLDVEVLEASAWELGITEE